MKKTTLQKLLEQLGMAPSKKMGQNFLIDDNFMDYIVREADVQEGENILEVGPGFGAITERLMQKNANLTAVEFDRKIAEWIRNTLVPRGGLNLIEGDACKVRISEIFGEDAEFRLISNLPYSAGTIVVANMLDLNIPPREMIIMLQKEVAERFAAAPGTEEYSSLTARIQTVYEVRILKTIPPSVFFPQPEIESCLIRLTRKDEIPPQALRKVLSRLARTAFAHRRKKMFKQVASVFGTEESRSVMTTVGVDPDIRAERVSPAQFLSMATLFAAMPAPAPAKTEDVSVSEE